MARELTALIERRGKPGAQIVSGQWDRVHLERHAGLDNNTIVWHFITYRVRELLPIQNRVANLHDFQ